MSFKNQMIKLAAFGALTLSSVSAYAEVFNFKVTAAGGKYSLNGDVTPAVNVNVGDTLVFDLSAVSGHPFYLTEKSDSKRALPAAKTTGTTLTLKVDASTPKDLFYSCTRHARMGSSITVLN